MLSLELCRVYHCTPLELERQPLDIVLAHLSCLAAESEFQKVESARNRIRRKRR
jgi:hypothetical protein